jgi:hypothetical protein
MHHRMCSNEIIYCVLAVSTDQFCVSPARRVLCAMSFASHLQFFVLRPMVAPEVDWSSQVHLLGLDVALCAVVTCMRILRDPRHSGFSPPVLPSPAACACTRAVLAAGPGSLSEPPCHHPPCHHALTARRRPSASLYSNQIQIEFKEYLKIKSTPTTPQYAT